MRHPGRQEPAEAQLGRSIKCQTGLSLWSWPADQYLARGQQWTPTALADKAISLAKAAGAPDVAGCTLIISATSICLRMIGASSRGQTERRQPFVQLADHGSPAEVVVLGIARALAENSGCARRRFTLTFLPEQFLDQRITLH